MDDQDEGAGSGEEELTSRDPSLEDLVDLCRTLNQLRSRYVVIGGFAIRANGYARSTGDVDLLIDTSPENEALAYQALETLPDQAVKELEPGDVAKYSVVRVADEIVVDLMGSACGIDYAEASQNIVVRVIDGVSIPFASPRLLWRMKATTHRAKDEADLVFLRQYFAARGEVPPES